ncbi:hypothetical protein KKB44_03675 [Candidatus Micrarchaeota archaeon]|nr:hypothetical protein [Candidatus Micrarchaeota archaeon]
MELGVDEKMPILKKNRLSTGILDLDLILEGGYRNPANIILIGPSGMEKAAFSYHFSGCTGPETTTIICGNASPEDIINKASTIGIDVSKVYFIDCYSATLGQKKESTENITVIDGPSALNDISLALNEAIKRSSGKRMRVVFDTLSTFILYNSQDSMRKFLSVIAGRLKSANATTLYLIDEGVHDKQVLSLIETGMDKKYTIEDKGGKFNLHIPDINIDIPIRLGPAGINVL